MFRKNLASQASLRLGESGELLNLVLCDKKLLLIQKVYLPDRWPENLVPQLNTTAESLAMKMVLAAKTTDSNSVPVVLEHGIGHNVLEGVLKQ